MMWMRKSLEEKSLNQCPVCHSEQLEALTMLVHGEGGEALFKPTQRPLKLLRPAHGFRLHGSSFQMCLDCGFLFRQESPDAFKEFLKQNTKN
jgi:predicted Zn-ribbon and HTH transcriptional regulator